MAEGDFGDDKAIADPAAGCSGHSFLEATIDIESAAFERGRKTEDQTSRRADQQCVEQGARIYCEIGAIRQILAHDRRNGAGQPMGESGGDKNAGDGAGQKERDVFGYQLPHEAHTAAPIPRRTAISFWREMDRPNCRLATLKQAMSSTQPTRPNTPSSGSLPAIFPTSSRSVRNSTPR